MSRAPRLVAAAFLPALLLAVLACASLPAPQGDGRIVIFHSNDIHGKIDNFAKVAAILERERAGGGADVFYFCAGDNFTGNPVIDQYRPPGEPMLELLNRLGVDLLCPGNHEFDYGLETLRNFAARARFPMVAANVHSNGNLPQLKPSLVLTTRSGIRLAAFGLIQVESGSGLPATHPDRVRGLRFSEPLQKALEMRKLRQGNQVLVALTHIGYDQDLLLAQEMPELDLIIGGHSHTRVNPAETVNGVLVAQAGSDNRFLGRVELRVRDGRVTEKKGELIDLRTGGDEDPQIKAMIARFNRNPDFERVIAVAPFAIEGDEALGSLMTDAMRRVHGLDIAFQNGGGIRLNRLAEKITIKDVYTLDPFGNQVVEIAMTAAEIRGLIADSFRKNNEIDLQVSGITYTVRTDDERRIQEIQLRGADGAPLPEDRPYTVGLSSYVASSYSFPHRDPGRALGATTVEALIRFLEGRPDFSIYRGIRRAFQDPPPPPQERRW